MHLHRLSRVMILLVPEGPDCHDGTVLAEVLERREPRVARYSRPGTAGEWSCCGWR
jgi:hypothetical protein